MQQRETFLSYLLTEQADVFIDHSQASVPERLVRTTRGRLHPGPAPTLYSLLVGVLSRGFL